MREDPIVVVPSDPRWADDFTTQRDRIEPALAEWLVRPIEHIGSTSIPGLPAKAIIDMVAVVRDHESFAPGGLAALADLGWCRAPEPGDAEARRWSVCYPGVEHRTHHLHVVEHDSSGWRDWLLFRDYVRLHPEAARRYAALKRGLAAQDQDDRVRYRAGKAPLISEILAQARAWAAD